MTNNEKIEIVFQSIREMKNIDYINELKARLEKKEIQMPKKSVEKGFKDYWVVYDTNLLSENNRIACIMTHVETNQKVIALHDFFDLLPQNVREFILYHEVGHLLNNHVFYNNKECERYKQERKGYFDKGEVHPSEILCDKYAVSRMGKEKALQALNYLIEKSKTSKELILRREILNSI